MTRNILSIRDAIAELTLIALSFDEKKNIVLEHMGKIVEERAKGLIGQDEVEGKGGFATWAPLADSTIEDKEKKGYDTPKPLLRDGELRESITHIVDLEHSAVVVGSDSDVAVYQELGTKNIPPRSFLGIAAEDCREEIEKLGLDLAISMFKR